MSMRRGAPAIGLIIVGALALAAGTSGFAIGKDPLLISVKPAKLTPLKKEAIARLDAGAAEIGKLSDEIWAAAEAAMEEYRSAAALAAYLEKSGFTVERGVAGLPTAFVGVYGAGEPVIGFLAEYDALPGLSQQAVSYQKPASLRGLFREEPPALSEGSLDEG